MSYAVSNGAVGKSPLIDKINKLPAGHTKGMVAKEMEQLVCEHSKAIYPTVSISFSKCQDEVRQQFYRLP